MSRTFIAGASIVTRDAVIDDSSLVVEGDAILDIVPARVGRAAASARVVRVPDGSVVVPGFIDVHVHGVGGTDVLDDGAAVRRIADTMPRYGVTAFCPTSIACPPDRLATFLDGVQAAMASGPGGRARVLAAHLESNFISPEFRGAQPLECLCTAHGRTSTFAGRDILRVIESRRGSVGIVTLAPELEGGLDLTRRFVAAGIDVSVGHTGATFDDAMAAFDAGASRATHTFSAMRPLLQRDPGAVGAVLTRAAVRAEMICDGVHAHPASVALVLAVKPRDRFVAISDGTAASGLPYGSRSRLGWQAVTALDAARYDDGSLAGSVATMDQVFRVLVGRCGVDLVTAARVTATNPAHDRRLARAGVLEPGAAADFVVLSSALAVQATWIGGEEVWRR